MALSYTQAAKEIRALGLTVKRVDGEIRVSFPGNESAAYYTDDVEDALGTAQHMATEAAPKRDMVTVEGQDFEIEKLYEIGTVAGVTYYECPVNGDESPLLTLSTDADSAPVLIESEWWELPSEEEANDSELVTMAKFVFMVATDAKGEAALCEGGVYCNNAAHIFGTEYALNSFERCAQDVTRWNETARRNGWQARYEVRESLAGVSCDDSNVLSSLEAWQIDAMRNHLVFTARKRLADSLAAIPRTVTLPILGATLSQRPYAVIVENTIGGACDWQVSVTYDSDDRDLTIDHLTHDQARTVAYEYARRINNVAEWFGCDIMEYPMQSEPDGEEDTSHLSFNGHKYRDCAGQGEA